MKKLFSLLLLVGLIFGLITCKGKEAAGETAPAKDTRLEIAPDVLRSDTLIVENSNPKVSPADDFNRWRTVVTSATTGLQEICLDALWYIDPEAGVNGIWENALAAERPIYNKDFTEMTIKLRQGMYWSDGVEFTADDVIYTIEVQKSNPGFMYSVQFATYVDTVEKIDKYTVTVYLKAPHSRFHGLFTIRWSGCYIMPKHIFEKAPDPLAFKFNPPVSIGAYTLKDFDPQGYWYLWEKRDDWQRTPLGQYGEPAPKYALFVGAGSNDVKIMQQKSHQLDVINNIAAEGMVTIAKTLPESQAWFPKYPWGHPDPTLVAALFNMERRGLDNRDIRWALTLTLDIVQVAMASSRGATTISGIHLPPTGLYQEYYFDPLEPWLKDFTLDLGNGEKFKPYDPDASWKIAEEARKTLGDFVSTDPAEIRKLVGAGWWKRNVDAAEKLMLKAGMKRGANNMWVFPDGTPFKIAILNQENRPVVNRTAVVMAEAWKEFGVDTVVDTRDVATTGRLIALGDCDVELGWNVETWGGHPDLFFFLESWHSRVYKPLGEPTGGRNRNRWRNPELDRIIDAMQSMDFDDPKIIGLGQDYVKLSVNEMTQIPLMSNVMYSVADSYYWTGFPSSDNPYGLFAPTWGNCRTMFTQIKKVVR
jgi:peptide/nickel transport system substrate-binding protein